MRLLLYLFIYEFLLIVSYFYILNFSNFSLHLTILFHPLLRFTEIPLSNGLTSYSQIFLFVCNWVEKGEGLSLNRIAPMSIVGGYLMECGQLVSGYTGEEITAFL